MFNPNHHLKHNFPPEIWSGIFDYATHVPGTLIPDIYDYAHLVGPDYSRAFYPRLREALVTKRAIVRVCKQWWHLAVPYLYRSLYIGRVRCLSSLSATLAADRGTLVSGRPLVEYIQRLDIAIRDHSVDVSADFRSLAAIIKHLSNLAIISFGTSTHFCGRIVPRDMLCALHRIAPTLCVLDCGLPSLGVSADAMTNLIPKLTRLRVLNCPWLVWSRQLEHGGIPPTLTTLRVGIIVPIEIEIIFFNFDAAAVRRSGPSALQELILHNHIFRRHDLLHVYSSQLVSVQLCIHSPSNVEADMELITRTCPNLRRLTLTSRHFSYFVRPNLVFPSITYLGLRTTWHQSTRRDFKILFLFLEELELSVPSLRVVQLLNEHNVCCLLRSHAELAKRSLQTLVETAQFRVEDREGVLLTDRLRAVGHL